MINKNVFIANPNAPTGLTLSIDEISKICESNRDYIVLIDEAYVDFGAESSASLTQKYGNLITVMTYSKSRSMAGSRLGFAIANEELVKDLEKIKYSTNPYSINRLTNLAGIAAIKDNDYYFFDRDRKIIYLRHPYDKDNTFSNGKVYVELTNGEILELALSIHHVWNFLDEFGALFGCTRLYGENNYNYKKRILDVFINPASSTKFGLANGIARELGLRKYKTWEDPRYEFIIKDEMVIVNTITKNGEYISLENLYINADGYIVLKPDMYEEERDLTISYITGIEINSLANSNSNKFSNEIYKADGTPSDLLMEYVDEIKNNSSILWNDFYYDETMWVKDEDEFEIGHYSFIPAKYDSSIKGFAKYGFSKTNR